MNMSQACSNKICCQACMNNSLRSQCKHAFKLKLLNFVNCKNFISLPEIFMFACTPHNLKWTNMRDKKCCQLLVTVTLPGCHDKVQIYSSQLNLPFPIICKSIQPFSNCNCCILSMHQLTINNFQHVKIFPIARWQFLANLKLLFRPNSHTMQLEMSLNGYFLLHPIVSLLYAYIR